MRMPIRLGLLVVLVFLLFLPAVHAMSVEEARQVMILSEEYGISIDALSGLREKMTDWSSMKVYLNDRYPKRIPDISTKDCVRLHEQTGISPIEAITAYTLAIKYRRDPAWIASLYVKNRNWSNIKDAFEKKEQLQSLLISTKSEEHHTQADLINDITLIYGIPSQSLQEAVAQGMPVELLADLVFVIDAESDKDILQYPFEVTPLPENWRDMVSLMAGPVNTVWPERKFPMHTLSSN